MLSHIINALTAVVVGATIAVAVLVFAKSRTYYNDCKVLGGYQLKGPYNRNLCVVKDKVVNLNHLK